MAKKERKPSHRNPRAKESHANFERGKTSSPPRADKTRKGKGDREDSVRKPEHRKIKSRGGHYSPATNHHVKEEAYPAPEANLSDRLEGRNPIREALRAGRNFNKVWIAKRSSGQKDPDLKEIIKECYDSGAVVVEVERDVLNKMSSSHGHQGIIAQVAAHEYVSLDSILQRGTKRYQEEGVVPFIILLDGLMEGYNLGSILRIADAFGITGIVIPKRRSVALDAFVAKASAGAVEYVPVARVTNIKSAIAALKEQGFWIYGACGESKTVPEACDFRDKTALIIGNEGSGISQSVRSCCDVLVQIPQYGHVNSLNAAVACGVLVAEAMRQRRAKNTAEGANE